MTELRTIWRTVLGAVAAALYTAFGAWNHAMTALVVLICLDIASGWLRAYIQQELSSKESWRGLAKKILIYVAIAVAAQVDVLLGKELLRYVAIAWYCGHEGLSVVENVVAAGLPVPGALRAALKQLNEEKYVDRS